LIGARSKNQKKRKRKNIMAKIKNVFIDYLSLNGGVNNVQRARLIGKGGSIIAGAYSKKNRALKNLKHKLNKINGRTTHV